MFFELPYCGGAPLGSVNNATTSIAATMRIGAAQRTARTSTAGELKERRDAGRKAHETSVNAEKIVGAAHWLAWSPTSK
jgi:hypothetical protein